MLPKSTVFDVAGVEGSGRFIAGNYARHSRRSDVLEGVGRWIATFDRDCTVWVVAVIAFLTL